MPFTLSDRLIEYDQHLQSSIVDVNALLHGRAIVADEQYEDRGGLVKSFYSTYYQDFSARVLILAINPGRLGAGKTGIPLTDPYHLRRVGVKPLGNVASASMREPTSTFFYKVVDAFGGCRVFYERFLVHFLFPFSLVKEKEGGKGLVNCNYYDVLNAGVYDKVIASHVDRMLKWGTVTPSIVICLGKGKNFQILQRLNKRYCWFEKVLELPHPRFIMQYRYSQLNEFIEMYCKSLMGAASEVALS